MRREFLWPWRSRHTVCQVFFPSDSGACVCASGQPRLCKTLPVGSHLHPHASQKEKSRLQNTALCRRSRSPRPAAGAAGRARSCAPPDRRGDKLEHLRACGRVLVRAAGEHALVPARGCQHGCRLRVGMHICASAQSRGLPWSVSHVVPCMCCLTWLRVALLGNARRSGSPSCTWCSSGSQSGGPSQTRQRATGKACRCWPCCRTTEMTMLGPDSQASAGTHTRWLRMKLPHADRSARRPAAGSCCGATGCSWEAGKASNPYTSAGKQHAGERAGRRVSTVDVSTACRTTMAGGRVHKAARCMQGRRNAPSIMSLKSAPSHRPVARPKRGAAPACSCTASSCPRAHPCPCPCPAAACMWAPFIMCFIRATHCGTRAERLR